MKLSQLPELLAFFSSVIAHGELEGDFDAVRTFLSKAPSEKKEAIASQGRQLLSQGSISVEELGSEANRWFGSSEEAHEWLSGLIALFDESGVSAGHGAGVVVVKDSNGAALAEGDSVQVIKDLKVRGGTSDLKRGTLIRKIHLVDDPEVIECRVDGATLVLKTCFLKKA